jgi:hypothetical protein
MLVNADPALNHPFKYARLIGIYHTNIIYVGHGTPDYKPRRMEFLWVRWYRNVDASETSWEARKLDRISFLPLTDPDAFGFVDPSEVLRGCHVTPAFSKGRLHNDGKGTSRCARDHLDWAQYYITWRVCPPRRFASPLMTLQLG